MITKETLEAVKVGILTDEQLNESIKHYSDLEKNLRCHGDVYHLVWKDVHMTLMTLNGYKVSRMNN